MNVVPAPTELVFIKTSDGQRLTRIEMEQQIREGLKAVHQWRLKAIKPYGLDSKLALGIEPIFVLHWLLDEMVRRNEIIGNITGIQPGLHTDPKNRQEFIVRLAYLVQAGEAFPPIEGEGTDMSEVGKFIPPGGAPQGPSNGPGGPQQPGQQTFPPPPPMGAVQQPYQQMPPPPPPGPPPTSPYSGGPAVPPLPPSVPPQFTGQPQPQYAPPGQPPGPPPAIVPPQPQGPPPQAAPTGRGRGRPRTSATTVGSPPAPAPQQQAMPVPPMPVAPTQIAHPAMAMPAPGYQAPQQTQMPPSVYTAPPGMPAPQPQAQYAQPQQSDQQIATLIGLLQEQNKEIKQLSAKVQDQRAQLNEILYLTRLHDTAIGVIFRGFWTMPGEWRRWKTPEKEEHLTTEGNFIEFGFRLPSR